MIQSYPDPWQFALLPFIRVHPTAMVVTLMGRINTIGTPIILEMEPTPLTVSAVQWTTSQNNLLNRPPALTIACMCFALQLRIILQYVLVGWPASTPI